MIKNLDHVINEILNERALTDGKPLLYARYDMVRTDDGKPLLIEAELFEP